MLGWQVAPPCDRSKHSSTRHGNFWVDEFTCKNTEFERMVECSGKIKRKPLRVPSQFPELPHKTGLDLQLGIIFQARRRGGSGAEGATRQIISIRFQP